MIYGTSYSTKELQELLTETMFIKSQGSEIQLYQIQEEK